MTWKADERHRKTFGPFGVVSERNDDNETAHLVTLTDQTIRVLPDDHTSGQKRSRTITEALKTLEALDPDPKLAKTILIGALAEEDLTWEEITTTTTCVHLSGVLEASVGSPQDDGRVKTRVDCELCGARWGGLLEPLATDEELARL